MPCAPGRLPWSSFSNLPCSVSCSWAEKRTMPGPTSGFGVSGDPGRKKKRRIATQIVKRPSTRNLGVSSRHSVFAANRHSRIKSHCQPLSPLEPLSFKIPDASNGLMAFPPNMPKKRIATLFASSLLTYQVDRVYTAPGMYPASAKPKASLEMRKPVRSLRKTCMVATVPKRNTCSDIHFRGPICHDSVSVGPSTV